MIDWTRRFGKGLCDLKQSCCDLLFPPRCVGCGGELADLRQDWHLCGKCLAEFLPAAWHGCNRCGSEIPDGGGTDGCDSCRHAKLHFDAVIPLGGYHSGLREAVVRMKRPSHDALSLAMGRLLVERQRERLAELRADLVVPIPMYWWRRLGRGTNSPELLGACLAKTLGAPMRTTILARRRNTLPQTGLPPSRRIANVRGAFRVRRPGVLKDARVLLVDDVLTTGATCSEAAATLKRAGAAMVAVAVVARAEGHLFPKPK